MDLAGAARSHRWELSSRTCLAVLRKSKQPDKCLAAHPRTTLRNVLPTSAPASVAGQETGKQNLCQGAGKSHLELPRVRRTRGGKGAQEGNQFLKSHLKMETMTENVPGVLLQLMVWLGRRSLCPGTFFRAFGHSGRSRG